LIHHAAWRTAGRLLLALLPAGAAWTAPAPPPIKDPADTQWVFAFLPKAFQRNPRLDLTVITELTAEGKKRPEVSVQHPAYYIAQSAGYRRTIGAPSGDKTLPPDKIDEFVRRSLATRGYQPASTASPATLVLVYSWGVHARLDQDGLQTGDQLAQNLLDRAGLVGGEKFKAEFMAMLAEATAQVDAAVSSPTRHMTMDGAAVAPVLGPEQLEFISPVNRFRERSAKNEFLLEQVAGDVYFVIVSAYDHEALGRGQRVLLWRTKMTVSADGVSQTDSLPALINSAAPYFGRDMSEPATLTPRTFPKGRVKLAPLTFPDEEPDAPTMPVGGEPRK
jgi:hypothetical protein